MKLRIEQTRWYAEKARFVKLYKGLGYRWVEGRKEGNGWFSPGGSSYLLSIEMDKEFKRFFIKDCSALANFILSIGGVDETEKVVIHKGVKEYHFIGADLWSWYRLDELLEDCSDYFGAVWK